jgi:hypothetical protein
MLLRSRPTIPPLRTTSTCRPHTAAGEDRRAVAASQARHHALIALVAVGQQHHAVEVVRLGHELHRIGDIVSQGEDVAVPRVGVAESVAGRPYRWRGGDDGTKCVFRTMSTTDSDRSRPPIPVMSTAHSGAADGRSGHG